MEESDDAELLHAGAAGEAVGDGAVDWEARDQEIALW
jgi:hypothetical protein